MNSLKQRRTPLTPADIKRLVNEAVADELVNRVVKKAQMKRIIDRAAEQAITAHVVKLALKNRRLTKLKGRR